MFSYPDEKPALRANAGYGLWLCPDRTGVKRLSGFIHDFAERYTGPRFMPHITLVTHLSTFSEASLTAGKCSKGPAIDCAFDRAECGAAPFRSLMLLPRDPTPFVRLRRLSAARDSGPEYVPHLSVYYGQLAQRQAHEALSELSAQLPVSVQIGALEVHKLSGNIDEWQRLKRIELAPTQLAHT